MVFNLEKMKDDIRQKSKNNPEKYYPVKSLQKLGFNRSICEHCGKALWSVEERNFCDEPECRLKSGLLPYGFIDDPPTAKRFNYTETWIKAWVPIFEKHGHTIIPRYPIVARWRNDTEFVQASVYGFQPLVVSGEVDPPANPVLIPQPCLRFNDIDNVGLSGRHFTSFVMVGQLVFNKPGKFIYFMDEGIGYINDYLTTGLGINSKEIVYHEDAWGGGGNLGSSLEFFIRGLEVGNQVYMTYKIEPNGNFSKLSTTVIDMGAGLGRSTWLINGTPTQYEVNFNTVLPKALKKIGLKPNVNFWKNYARYSGVLNYTETDVARIWVDVAKSLDMDPIDLRNEIQPMKDIYSVIDHTRSLLWAISDGALPSNVGGGYNLRFLLRRAWSIIAENGWDLDVFDLIDWHMEDLKDLFPDFTKSGETVKDVIEVEYKRYQSTKEKGTKILQKKLKSSQSISTEELVQLYDSNGIVPEMVIEVAKDMGKTVRIPDDFYSKLHDIHEKTSSEKPLATQADIKIPEGIPDTIVDYNLLTFEGEVLWQEENLVILKTTGFYPTSGGQLHDLGSIDGIPIKEVRKVGAVVVHILDSPLPTKRKNVRCSIDLHRRRILMSHHTATHVVNAAAREVLGPHIWQAGAEKTIEKGRLDITHFDSLTQEQMDLIEQRANEIVYENIEVSIEILPRDIAEKRYGFTIYQGGAIPEKDLRIVAIDDIDIECCGGTHANRTGDIGPIVLLSSERIQDGIVRLEYVSGETAVREIQRRNHIVQETLDMWGIDLNGLPSTAKRFFNEWKAQKKELLEVKKEKASIEAQLLEKKIEKLGKIHYLAEALSGDADYLSQLVFTLTKKIDDLVILLIDRESLFITIGAGKKAENIVSSNDLISIVTKEMGGSGGGKIDFARGSGKDPNKINSAIAKFKEILTKKVK
ncbi:MAG: alanine--tRNA ligase [Candidatus Heimdallarchaeota archaeon]|nr:alanine--tRNA ligase [Candidatus Heimdallarchaeota archaeon]